MNSSVRTIHWLGLALSLALLGTVLTLRSLTAHGLSIEDPELLRLRSEHTALVKATSGISEQASLKHNRRAEQEFNPQAWSAKWSVLPIRLEDTRKKTWRMVADKNPNWSDFIDAIIRLEPSPGLRIISLDISSRGTLLQREIASLEIILEQPNETPPRLGVADGAVFPGLTVPAMTPEVGAGALLVRPSASAEPPATGRLAPLSGPTTGSPGPVVINLNP